MANLILKNINKIYPNGVQAVYDFNLEIKDKEFIVFVGPSGCGKSTTLRMIAGLEDITSGEFLIDGQLMNQVEPKNRDIAMVFQNYALYPHMTVYGNMKFALKLRKVFKPVYAENHETDALKEANQNLMKQVKKINRAYKKVQSNEALVAERWELYKQIFKNEEEIESKLTQLVGKDEYKIKELGKNIEKTKKEIARNDGVISKYESQYPEQINVLKEMNENISHQLSRFEQELEYLNTHDVPLTKLRHLTRYEMDLEINKVAETIDLLPYLFRKPSALSGGQRQRVALGRAIVRKPRVFLMDEPLSNLDAKLRVQTRSEIIKIHQRVGATTIYVTHDQVEALTMADRIVVMKDGYVQQIGAPKEVYYNPQNKFVAGFIGAPAMNFIAGTIENNVFTADKAESERKDMVYSPFTYELPSSLAEVAKQYNHKKIYLGIRPEHVHLAGDKANNNPSSPFELVCDFSEMLGQEYSIYTFVNGQKLIFKVDDIAGIKTGDPISVCFDEKRLYLFDFETEKRIEVKDL